MFENVTYTFYTNTLGRAVIPSESAFNELKLINIQIIKKMLNYIQERETNGIDSAVCMMCETDYKYNELINGSSGAISSESVSGHTVNFDNSVKSKVIDKSVKSLDEQKMDDIKLFCDVFCGVA